MDAYSIIISFYELVCTVFKVFCVPRLTKVAERPPKATDSKYKSWCRVGRSVHPLSRMTLLLQVNKLQTNIIRTSTLGHTTHCYFCLHFLLQFRHLLLENEYCLGISVYVQYLHSNVDSFDLMTKPQETSKKEAEKLHEASV